MARKALCLGISEYPGVNGDLPGCVNDARAWAALLREHYGFASPDVRLLLDEQATRRGILAALDALLARARPGDVLVFTNSSHGTYVPDRDGDDAPTCEEAICPYDYRANLIVDGELRERFTAVAPGVRVVFISDSCHSGALSRFEPPGRYRRARFLAPEEWGGRSLPMATPASPQQGRSPDPHPSEILLAGCRSSQYSFDALIDGRYHGAMTWFALQAIREHRYDLSYSDLHARLCELLADGSFPQDPRLEGPEDARKRRLFS